MRRTLCAIGLILASWAFDAHAGSYTVTTSSREDQALAIELDRWNARTGESKTVDELVQHLFNQNLRPIREQFDVQETVTACDNYRALSAADRQTVRQLLGGLSPCR